MILNFIPKQQKKLRHKWPEIQAHRGYHKTARENTLDAFTATVKKQIPAIEFDVRVSTDFVLVVFHDRNLKRFFKSRRLVLSLTAEELWSKYQIPTLERVIQEYSSDLKFNIEVKCEPNIKSVEATITALKKFFSAPKNKKLHSKVIVSSFNYFILFWLRTNYPEITRALLISPQMRMRLVAGFWLTRPHWVHWPEKRMTAKLCAHLHKLGYKVAVWTVQSKKRMNELTKMKVDSLICDPQCF